MGELRYKQTQFEKKLDRLLITNSATVENAWTLTGDEPIQSGGPTREDEDVGQESHMEFMESFSTTKYQT